MLQEAQICDVPLLFVLSHFSSFCHQSKQTLLYTLLDLCSNKNVRICIVGMDRDCCITELLEKRIQSRLSRASFLTCSFSQRQIIISYPSSSDIAQFVSATLFLPGTDTSTKKWNSAVRRIVLSPEFSTLVDEQSLLVPLSFHILFSSAVHLHPTRPRPSAAVCHLHPARLHRWCQLGLLAHLLLHHHTAEYTAAQLHTVLLQRRVGLMYRSRLNGHDPADRSQTLRAAQGRQLLLFGPDGKCQPVRA